MPAVIYHNILLLRSVVTLFQKFQSNANHNSHNFRKVDALKQEFMLKRKYFDETPAENLSAFSRKNRQQFAGHANDGTEDVGKANVLLHSSKTTDEQITKQDAPGN